MYNIWKTDDLLQNRIIICVLFCIPIPIFFFPINLLRSFFYELSHFYNTLDPGAGHQFLWLDSN